MPTDPIDPRAGGWRAKLDPQTRGRIQHSSLLAGRPAFISGYTLTCVSRREQRAKWRDS